MMVEDKKIKIKSCDTDYMRQNGLDYVLTRGANGTYICDFCKDNHKTGLYRYTKNGIPKCKCFHCGFQGDVFDYVGELYGYSNYYDKQVKTADLMNLTLENDIESKPIRKAKPKQQQQQVTIQGRKDNKQNIDTDLSVSKDINTLMQENKEFYGRAHKRLLSSQGVFGRDYLYSRRITDETINKFNIGFSKEDNIIFPITFDYYIERSISKKRYLNRCLNGSKLFKNFRYADLQEFDIVLVCEGLIDALTVLQTHTFDKVISLNGVSNADKFIETAAMLKDKNLMYIIQLDIDKAGEEAQEHIVKSLKKQGSCVFSSPMLEKSTQFKNIKDINELYCIDEKPLLKNFKTFNKKMQAYQEILKAEKESKSHE